MPADQPFDLQAKFRAVSRALRASYDAEGVRGGHGGEKGLQRDSVLGQFLARHLPPSYGVSRGEVVAANGAISRQVDVVIYDALRSPLLQDSDVSRVFPAECVYTAIELKPVLNRSTLAEAVSNIASVNGNRPAIQTCLGVRWIGPCDQSLARFVLSDGIRPLYPRQRGVRRGFACR